MLNRILLLFLLCIYNLSVLNAQYKSSSEILEDIKKLNVLGSVLYVAAHPDDENTRLISYLTKDKKYRTAYVSLTRGDGGQNLIGPQLDEFLGVIRTNELIEARRIDGGIQFFTRANDFGYSKNAEETFTIWNKDSLLLDLVRIIREFQPDVIINRFDHRSSGRTHGHHTASAILAEEAFREASHSLYRVSEMKDLEPVIVPRLFFNTSIWHYGSREKFEAADKSNMYSMDLGTYYPSLGMSNGEISAQSRSMHKSQGFGMNSVRGSQIEYFERIGAKKEADQNSPFDGLNLSWTRVNGGGNIENVILQVLKEYDINNPSASIPLLQKAEKYIFDLAPGHWRDIKLEEIKKVIFNCSGIYAEATTDKQIVSNGMRIKINTEFICRTNVKCELQKIIFLPSMQDTVFDKLLPENSANLWSSEIDLFDLNNTSAFWLKHGRGKSLYSVDDKKLRSKPLSDKELITKFYFKLNGVDYSLPINISYKNDDPVHGEVNQPLDVLPSIIVEPFDHSLLINNNKGNAVRIQLRSRVSNQSGVLKLKLPQGIIAIPDSISFKLDQANELKEFEFKLTTLQLNNKVYEVPILLNDQQAFVHTTIKYPHISWQNVLTPASVLVSALDIKTKPENIGYINGAGDYIDDALRKLNYNVIQLNPNQINSLSPSKIPVVIFGIRAWNTNDDLPQFQSQLLEYVARGGRLIFQYNTTSELKLGKFLGDSFKITRERITDEASPVRILNTEHSLLNKPNKITIQDFKDWIQERGLYYPNNYSSDWEELLAMNDPNEKELKSAILFKNLGKGTIIYSPLSWFRQLPAGVPGAYRLFVNLITVP
ncbi:MAG: PIG-L family deacetylase [Saprospiraceae bacterium]|nr:PIG-L family deacetylase [Saprospiraceae bacterium]